MLVFAQLNTVASRNISRYKSKFHSEVNRYTLIKPLASIHRRIAGQGFRDPDTSQWSVRLLPLNAVLAQYMLGPVLTISLSLCPSIHPLQSRSFSLYTAASVISARRYASAVYMLSTCLSACPSVTSRHFTNLTKRRITQTTPYDSPGTL